MGGITLEIPESQVVEWVKRMSPEAKRAVLRTLIPRLDEFEELVARGSERMRVLCARRGLDWDSLSEREELIDELLHENGGRT